MDVKNGKQPEEVNSRMLMIVYMPQYKLVSHTEERLIAYKIFLSL